MFRLSFFNDGDRASWKGDTTVESHLAAVSNPSTSAISEPAISTLLSPLRAQYHKFAVDGATMQPLLASGKRALRSWGHPRTEIPHRCYHHHCRNTWTV